MAGIVWRVLIAVLAFAVAMVLIPLVLGVLGVPLEAPILVIVRICLGVLAGIYIVWGAQQPPWGQVQK